MREILFRGKDARTNEWRYGSLLDFDRDSGYLFIVEPYLNASTIPLYTLMKEHAHFVAPSTVGQYTGLVDKNGKKIFEGDIVLVPRLGKSYEVKFMFGQFFVGINCPVAYERHTCEVIGNIHDNPELLEEGKR